MSQSVAEEMAKLAGLFSSEPEVSTGDMLGAAATLGLTGAFAPRNARNLMGIDKYDVEIMTSPDGSIPGNPNHWLTLSDGGLTKGVNEATLGDRVAANVDRLGASLSGDVPTYRRHQMYMRTGMSPTALIYPDELAAGKPSRAVKLMMGADALDDIGTYVRGNKLRATLGALGLLAGGAGAIPAITTLTQGAQERM